MSEPEEAIGGGPYIYIAVPRDLVQVVPFNATRLLEEWTAQLNPVESLGKTARRSMGVRERWELGRSFVEPSGLAMSLIKAAATDVEVLDALDD